jgi:hypothetical protein
LKSSVENFLNFEKSIDSFDVFTFKGINFYGALRTHFSYTLFINSKKLKISLFFRFLRLLKSFIFAIRSFNINYFKKSSVIFLAEFNDYQYEGNKVSYEVFETMSDFFISKNCPFEIIKFNSNNKNGVHFRDYRVSDFENLFNLVSVFAKFITPISYILNYKKFKRVSSHFYFGTFSPFRCSLILNETYLMYLIGIVVINIKRPKYFVASSFTSLPFQGLLLAAKVKGIEFIDIQHGTIFDLNYTYTNNFINLKQLPDKYLVYSNFEIQKLKLLNNVYSTGNLRIEFYNRYHQNIGKKFERIILFSLQYDISDEILKFYIDTYSTLVKQYNLNVKIRLHPRSINDEVLKNKIINFTNKSNFDEILIFSKFPIYEVLSSTLIHVTVNSSVFLDALNFGVFSIIVNSKFSNDFSQYHSTGLVKIVSMENIIEEIVSLIDNMPNNRSFESKYFDHSTIFDGI